MTKIVQSVQWMICATFLLALLAACESSTSSTAQQGTGIALANPRRAGNVTTSAQPGSTTTNQPEATATLRPDTVPTPTPNAPIIPQPTLPVIVPTPTPQPPAGGGNTIPAAQAVFTLINQERASAGLPAYTWSNQLVQSAHQHNINMVAANQLSHQLPGEASFGDRERQAGVNWFSAAENIGYGSGDPTKAAVGLNQSMFGEQPPNDGHRRNILSTSCTMVGIDVVVDSQHNKVWLTEDFAAV
ncbi:CAP domain-containing protein [Tengunoibacter tsumagoiensis]|uniref:SCP domain-containing protein n=1 Tax=Tengunoibacter tsumagoiensis TaxID=2014871 RepID=A0A402A007_9CHLR|nr:CAP domain-containing protein [Tengunoibacter tsumagoiensis]GCE12406.1 hypothetical protein KTT_22650 [Tengunoibacter tsumagoiensis]